KATGVSAPSLQAHRYQDDGLTLVDGTSCKTVHVFIRALIDWLKSVFEVTPEDSQKEPLLDVYSQDDGSMAYLVTSILGPWRMHRLESHCTSPPCEVTGEWLIPRSVRSGRH
ncbi:hypothetical protein JMJ77_0009433, partial [Colletotrichum scovillei]